MKNHFILLFGLLAFSLTAQNKNAGNIQPVEVRFQPVVFEKTECISDEARAEARQAIARNKKEILKTNPNAFRKTSMHPMFVLPIQAKAGFSDYGYYTLNFQVDHNTTPGGNLQDYNCLQRTYDWATGNHAGSDYILWPYPWRRMQDEVMEIVAAAPGTIVDKRDGNFDLNCQNNGNPNWNGIVLEHSDGSETWYLHFKDGAITAKGIGDSVAMGEYLGAAGSSGSSTTPHLHFEVYDANDNLVDPYSGTCNSLNTGSWWANQPNYLVPTINRLSTHYSFAFDNTCPNVENTYEELNFQPGDLFVFRAFYRDLQDGVDTDFTIYDPNGNVFATYTWTSNYGVDYATAYASFSYNITTAWPDGVYTLEAVFGGNTYTTIFGVNTNLGVEEIVENEFEVYPNPVSDQLTVSSKTEIQKMEVFDLSGRKVIGVRPNMLKTNIKIGQLANGLYILSITSEGKTSSRKIVKE